MIFGYSIGYMFLKKKLWEVYSHLAPAGYTTLGEEQEKKHWKLKATGYLKVRFIATCKFMIILYRLW